LRRSSRKRERGSKGSQGVHIGGNESQEKARPFGICGQKEGMSVGKGNVRRVLSHESVKKKGEINKKGARTIIGGWGT